MFVANLNATIILASLVNLMKNNPVENGGPLQAYIVPSGDAHLSEYIAECDKRMAYVTKFIGSAGTALILANSTHERGYLWTDGRYFDQADQELDKESWETMRQGQPGVPNITVFLLNSLNDEDKVGVDPTLFSKSSWDAWTKALDKKDGNEAKNIILTQVDDNLVDIVWKEDGKPACSGDKIVVHNMTYAGEEVADKIEKIAQVLDREKVDLLVVTELDEIAWALNLRGLDFVPFNPVFKAYLTIDVNKNVSLFVNRTLFQGEFGDVEEHLSKASVVIHPYEEILTFLEEYESKAPVEAKVWLGNNCNYAISNKLSEARLIIQRTPITDLKVVKNDVECKGMIESHKRDGAAKVQFFAWLEEKLNKGEVLKELDASAQLDIFREGQDHFVTPSFYTIMGSGANAATIHYSPMPGKDAEINKTAILLVDSGGQYLDGTTDVTRTVHFGVPSPKEIECFTLALKGFISLRNAVMINGTGTTEFLDRFARQPLWKIGVDYNHGTGHGIGSYLSVHEGPIGISGTYSFKPNMFVSNEPGYYETGAFGIRHENIIRSVAIESKYGNDAGRIYLGFEDVTLVPIQQRMINASLLSDEEIDYLNGYHKECLDNVGPILQAKEDQRAYNWLVKETKPIIKYPISGGNGIIPSVSFLISSIVFIFFAKYF